MIGRAAKLFDRLYVLVTHNPGKSALLGVDERVRLLRASMTEAGIDGVEVDSWSEGLLVKPRPIRETSGRRTRNSNPLLHSGE